MMSHIAEVDFVENVVKERIRYETIFERQSEVLKADLPNYEAAVWRVQFVAGREYSQPWKPTKDNVDEYLAYCDELCQLVPQNFDDRVKILHGAHAALMCLTTCKIAHQPQRIQLAITKRHNELSVNPTTSPTVDNRQSPPPKPAVESRHITAKELRSFRNPDNLLGRQFILSPDTDDPATYEVIGYSKERDKKVRYDILFDGCDDSLPVDEEEMMRMLHDSLYSPV